MQLLIVALMVLSFAASGSANAQAVTAADLDAMIAEFDRSHQRTLESIKQAQEAVKPVADFVHLPPSAIALGAYAGKQFVSVESGLAMRVSHSEDGTPRVGFVNIDATPLGGFLAVGKQATATATHEFYNLHQTPFAQCPANSAPRTAWANRDGSDLGFGWSCGGDRSGRGAQRYSYSLKADGPGIKTTFVSSNDKGISTTEEHVYLPITQDLVTAAAARLRQRIEEERLRQQAIQAQRAEAEREKRRASQERVRSFNRAMEGMNGILNDAVAEVGTYDDAQANLDATVANIQDAAAAERQQLLHTEQQKSQARASQDRQDRYDESQVLAANAEAAAERARQAGGNSTQSNGGIDAQPRPIATAARQAEPKCSEAPGFRKIFGYAEKTRELAMRSMTETPHLEPLQDVSCTQPPNLGYTLEGWWKCTAMAPTGLMVKHCPQSNSGVSSQ